MTRRCVPWILLCALLFGSTGCSLFSDPSPQDAFRAFAEALGRKDAAAAGAVTDDQTAATAAITSMLNGMAKDVPIAESYRGVMPFLISDTVRTIILLLFPSISLWLVKYIG